MKKKSESWWSIAGILLFPFSFIVFFPRKYGGGWIFEVSQASVIAGVIAFCAMAFLAIGFRAELKDKSFFFVRGHILFGVFAAAFPLLATAGRIFIFGHQYTSYLILGASLSLFTALAFALVAVTRAKPESPATRQQRLIRARKQKR